MATIGRLVTIAFLGLPLLSATPAVACIPAEHYTTQNSIDIAEGFVIARYGRIEGVPVPLAAAKMATLFGAGDGVAVVFVDRVVKGTSPRIIFVSQGLVWIGSHCRGEMPGYGRVTLLSGSRKLTSEFGSFFGPFGFHVGTFDDVVSFENWRRNASF